MKTSRLARETARTTQNAEVTTRRQTRTFAASIKAFTAENAADPAVKKEDEVSDDGSSLSSLASRELFDIEDAPVASPLRKRKRGAGSPTATVTTATVLEVPTKTSINSKDGSPARIKRGRKQPAKKITNEAGEVSIHPPANWQEIYTAVQEMRKKVLAPVDTMGCETLAEVTRTPRVRRPNQGHRESV